jgi:hypothetical protein
VHTRALPIATCHMITVLPRWFGLGQEPVKLPNRGSWIMRLYELTDFERYGYRKMDLATRGAEGPRPRASLPEGTRALR